MTQGRENTAGSNHLRAPLQLPAAFGRDLVPYVVAVFGVCFGLWTIFEVVAGAGSETIAFTTVMAWFILGAGAYLARAGTNIVAWCSVPVVLTVLGLFGYVVVPVFRLLSGNDVIDPEYLQAMTIVTVGFMSFWIVSWIAKRNTSVLFSPEEFVSERVTFAAFVMFVIGTLTTYLLFRAGLFSYTSDVQTFSAALPIIQWALLVASLLRASLIVSAIAAIGIPNCSAGMKAVFWSSLIVSLAFGFISAMKSLMLEPLFIVGVVYFIVRRRIPRSAILAIPLLLVVVYPFVNAYRATLNSGYRDQITSTAGLKDALARSFEDAFSGGPTTKGADSLRDTIDLATDRVSLLSDIQKLTSLPDPSILNGDEKVYLAPVYPFIPRMIWKSKPVLNKGQRLTMALGGGMQSSTAPTWVGDMWVLGGIPGVILGMSLYGLILQLFMNSMRGAVSSRQLFFFVVLLITLCDMERDVTSLVAYTTQVAVTYFFIGWLVYGGKVFVSLTDHRRIAA